MKHLLVLLLFATALSGCAKEGGDTATQDTDVADLTSLDVPTWLVGDYWTYETLSGQGEKGLNTYIVTSDQGGDYTVETDEKRQAEYNAREDFSMMGPQRKSDLAGSQGSNRIKFFDWPLEQDKTWKATWDGEALDMVAHDLGDGVFHIMGHRADGSMFAEYFYDESVKWMSSITWFDGNGTEQWAMTLTDSGSNFTGSIIRYTIGDTLSFVANGGPGVIHEEPSIDAEWNEIGVMAVLVCRDDQGQMVVGVNSATDDPNRLPMIPEVNDPEWGTSIDCGSDDVVHDMAVLDNSGGDWEVGVIQGTPNGAAHLFLEKLKVETLAFPFA